MVLQQVLEEEPAKPRRLNDSIPRDLETICLKAMAKAESQRYATAKELAADLERWLDGEPILARPVGRVERAWRWSRRRPAMAALVTTVPILLLSIALISSASAWWLSQERDNVRAEKKNVEREHRTAMTNLRSAYLAQAQGLRTSNLPGRRFKSLEVLKKAAEIEPGLDLRNEAIRCLALSDLRVARTWKQRSAMAFDHDMQRYATVDAQDNIIFSRVADDVEVARLEGAGTGGPILLFSPDGRYLAVRHFGQSAFSVWDIERRLKVLDVSWLRGKLGLTTQQFSADSRHIGIAMGDQTLRFYDLPSGTETHKLSLDAAIDTFAWHPEKKFVAVGSWDVPRVDLRNIETGELLKRTSLPGTATSLSWHPHGKVLAIACQDQTPSCYLWNIEKEEMHARLVGHNSQVTRCVFNHAGDLLATHGWDDTTRLWDPTNGKLLVSISGLGTQFGKGDRSLAFEDHKLGKFGYWEVAAPRELRTLHAYSEIGSGPWSVDIHKDGRLLAAAGDDGVRLWDLASGRELSLLKVGMSRTSHFLTGGDLVTHSASGLQRWPVGVEQETGVYRIGVPALLAKVESSPHYSNACLSDDGRRLAFVATPRQVWVIDPDRPDERLVLDGHDGLAYISISPDGRWVTTGTQHGSGIKVWDVAAQRCVKEIPAGHYGYGAFSPDSQTLITYAKGYPPGAWRTSDWELCDRVKRLEDAGSRYFDVRLHFHSCETGVLLRDANTGVELATLTPPENFPASGLSFHSSGSRLAASCNHHTVQIWDLGAIREQLRLLRLDWNLPLYPSRREEPSALQVRIEREN
jgi:WD40 repeat protein